MPSPATRAAADPRPTSHRGPANAPARSVVVPSAGYHVGMPPKTQREREAEQRELKLERIKEQVDDGSLVIRKMTDAERKANPPKPPREKSSKRTR